ncbi:MAG: ABC transporter permease [Bdellovibrionales bacterium]
MITRIVGSLALGLIVLSVLMSFMGYEIPTALVWADLFSALGFFAYYTYSQRMGAYVLKRLVEAGVTLFVIATLTFALLRVIPGGPFDEEKALPPEVKASIEAKYNLDKPLYLQYGIYMVNLLKGDLGESYKYLGRPVSQMIVETLPASFQLGVFALLICYIIGIPSGLIAASRHNTWVDNVTMVGAISGVALPSFVVAAVLILLFSFHWQILPAALWDGPTYYLLPMIALGTRPAAVIARLTRASVLEVIHSDYIRTAKAKGLSQKNILFKHVLKNSLIPVLTFSGPLISGLLTGSFIIEFMFAIPGMGKHLIQSVTNRDYPLILGMTLLYSAILVLANLIVDLLYSYFDPRINLSK